MSCSISNKSFLSYSSPPILKLNLMPKILFQINTRPFNGIQTSLLLSSGGSWVLLTSTIQFHSHQKAIIPVAFSSDCCIKSAVNPQELQYFIWEQKVQQVFIIKGICSSFESASSLSLSWFTGNKHRESFVNLSEH